MPKKLEDALSDVPLYNPSSTPRPSLEDDIDAARENLKKDRAKKKMLAEAPNENDNKQKRVLATDRHATEAAMMDEIFSKPDGNKQKPRLNSKMIGGGGGQRHARRSRNLEKNTIDEIIKSVPKLPIDNNLDDDDVSVGSVASSVGGGNGRRKTSPRVRNNNDSTSEADSASLLTAMTSRLTRLEMTTKRLKDEASKNTLLIKKQKKKIHALEEVIKNDQLEQRVNKLEELEDENDDLQAQIEDMTSFLSDYGLVWVGQNEHNDALKKQKNKESGERKAAATETETASASTSKTTSKTTSTTQSTPTPTPTPTPSFDRDIFVKRVNELNTMIQADKAKVVKDGQKAKLQYQNGVPIILYADGLVVNKRKLQKWKDEKCQR